MDHPALTLGDLLDGDLGLRLVTADPTARDQRVVGAHSIEIEHPGVWLERDWLMLTAGVRLRFDDEAQRRLVDELHDLGAAGLGVAEGIVFERVPAALVDEADRVGLPVFAVELRTPFRDVISAINRSMLSRDVLALQRQSSLQLFLMDALDDERPRRAVIERLAEFTGGVVTLFSAGGAVIDSTGDAPTDLLWQQIRRRPAALVQFDCDGIDAVATPLGCGRGDVSWLAITSGSSHDLPRTARPAARATAPVVAALARLDALALAQDRAVTATVVGALVSGRADQQLETAGGRAAALGLDFREPVTAIALRAPDGGAPPIERLVVVLERAVAAREVTSLVGATSDGCTLLAQGDRERIRLAVDDVLADVSGWAAGFGRAVGAPEEVPASFREAVIAAERARAGEAVDLDDLDVAALIVADVAPDRLNPKINQLLDVLRRQPALHEAVASYLEHDLDIMRAAAALHLHHNSLRYRLRRAEELLGRTLKDPATITSLYVALAADAGRSRS